MSTSESSRNDRRRANRFTTTMDVQVRFSKDGLPIDGACIEVGPNGMRVLTSMPLIEAALVLVSFKSASNDTFCEGRVVWTQRAEDGERFESGVDIQRWGGGVPGKDVVHKFPKLEPKKDRRHKSRGS